MRDTFVKTLLDIAKKDKNVYIITGDLGFGVLKPFWQEIPNQIINAGISEQNMTSVAAGLALEGKTVFTYSIGNFPTLRCIEQIRNDCCYHNANVKIVCVGGGFVYGSLGMSHHATEDIATIRALPNMTVFAPGDLIEARYATKAVYETQGTCYLRLGRGGEKRIHGDTIDFKVGKAIQIYEGKDVAILSTGGILDEVSNSVELLNKEGINPIVYSFPTIKPIDKETICKLAKEVKTIITVEEHNLSGGFGSSVCEVVAETSGEKAQVRRIALQDIYSSIVGSQQYLRKEYKLDSTAIVKAVKDSL